MNFKIAINNNINVVIKYAATNHFINRLHDFRDAYDKINLTKGQEYKGLLRKYLKRFIDEERG